MTVLGASTLALVRSDSAAGTERPFAHTS